MSTHTARDLPFKPSVHVVIMPSQLPLDLLATVRGIREDTLVRSMNICQPLSTKLIRLISVYNGRPRPHEYLDSRRGGDACMYVFIIRFKCWTAQYLAASMFSLGTKSAPWRINVAVGYRSLIHLVVCLNALLMLLYTFKYALMSFFIIKKPCDLKTRVLSVYRF